MVKLPKLVIVLVILMSGRQCALCQTNVTEISINGNVSVSIKTEGDVTALLLLLYPGGQQQQVKVNTKCKSSEGQQEPESYTQPPFLVLGQGVSATQREREVTRLPYRLPGVNAKPAKVTLNDIMALRVTTPPNVEDKSVISRRLTTSSIPKSLPDVRNCLDVLEQGDTESGIYVIRPYDCCPNRYVTVYCDQETDGGGWTVIQRRTLQPHQENFLLGWKSYVEGFGILSWEFWLGLNNIHALTNQSTNEIRFDLEDFEGERRWAKYDRFFVDGPGTDYRMEVSGYSGNAKDSFTRHNNRSFATIDHESSDKCASTYKGAWWYSICHDSNLNGQYLRGEHTSYADGINWRSWKGYYYSLKFTEMKIRPKH